MANPEVVQYGASVRTSLAGTYVTRGPHFARAVARQYIAECASLVSEVEGRDVAAVMLFRATDAVLADIPVQEFSLTPHCPEDKWEPVTFRWWSWNKIGWWLCGVITAPPIFAALHWITRW